MVRAEWMKVSRQGTTRILIGLLAGISLLFVIGLTISVTGTDTGSEALQVRQEAFSRLSFPGGIFTGLALVKIVGLFIVAIIFSSVLGSEYSLDTWKNLLVRNNARGGFLVAKLLVTGLALLIIFGIAVALTQLLALGGYAFVSDTATQNGLTSPALSADQFFHTLLVEVVPLLLNFAVIAAFATMLTIISRSTVAGILLTIVWNTLDVTVSLLVPSVGDATLGKNLASLGNHLDKAGSGEMPLWQNLAVLGIYFLIPMVVAIVTFRRRDMAGN
jgi:ABC-type transport system involved in multi-copper enzyme maturation permease subunit